MHGPPQGSVGLPPLSSELVLPVIVSLTLMIAEKENEVNSVSSMWNHWLNFLLWLPSPGGTAGQEGPFPC